MCRVGIETATKLLSRECSTKEITRMSREMENGEGGGEGGRGKSGKAGEGK